MANSKDAILAAVARLVGGSMPRRYQALDRGTASLVLKDAVNELVDLRSELRELYCRGCNKKYTSTRNPYEGKIVTCPDCGGALTSMAHTQLTALRNQVEYLYGRLERLELTIEELSGLTQINNAPE